MSQIWDPAHSCPAAVISNGGLTTTGASAGGYAASYATISQTVGKYYWELVVTTSAAGNTMNGIGNTASSVVQNAGYPGQGNTVGWSDAGTLLNGGASVGTWAAVPTGTRICFALDLDQHKLWGRAGIAGNWNNDVIGNQNPATNTGGFIIPAAVYASPVVPGCANFNNVCNEVASFEASSWLGTPPAGFVSFNAGPTNQIVVRSPFRLLPGKGPRPLVPQPWLGDFTVAVNANATIVQTQDDQTASITATVGSEPIARRSPFRLGPGKGPRPLVPQPWRFNFPADLRAVVTATQDDQTIAAAATNLDTAVVVQTQADQVIVATAAVGAEPIASRSPFRLLPGRGPRPLVPQPWRYYVQNANAVVTATQDDQTVTATASNPDRAAIVQTQDDQTVVATATVGAEPIAARSPFRLLPGKGPRPLVPQPWRYYVPLANAAITATQDDQTSSITATIGAEPIAVRSPFRLLPGRGPRPLVPQPWRGDFSTVQSNNAAVVQTQDDQTASATATNLDHASITQTQDDQTSVVTTTIGAEPIAVRSPFRLLPGRGPRPLVPNPWRYTVPPPITSSIGSIVQTQDDQTATITALLTHVANIDQNQDDHTISSTATLLAAAAIAQTQSNQTIVSAATNKDHAAIVQTQDDQTIVATALRLLPLTAVIVQTQQDQTIHMAAGQPRAVVAQPQFLW